MAVVRSGNARIDGTTAEVGRDGTGRLTLSAGAYAFETFNTGVDFDGDAATGANGVTRLTAGADVTVARQTAPKPFMAPCGSARVTAPQARRPGRW